MSHVANLVGYIVLLNFDVLTGVAIRLTANALVLPWAIRSKMWDFLALVSFLMSVDHELQPNKQVH